MTARIGAFTPETTERVLRAYQVFESAGLLRPGVLESLIAFSSGVNKQSEIYFKNNTGEEIPPYACLQVTGTEELGQGGTNYLVVQKPADNEGANGAFIFNSHSPVDIDGRGVAQQGYANLRGTYTSGIPVPGEKWRPVVGSFDLEQNAAGQFIAHGTDAIGSLHNLQVIKFALAIFQSSGGIIDLRLSGNDLQYTFDGVNWTTWHTGTTCP